MFFLNFFVKKRCEILVSKLTADFFCNRVWPAGATVFAAAAAAAAAATSRAGTSQVTFFVTRYLLAYFLLFLLTKSFLE